MAISIFLQGMRTCTNIFICNMALADLMTILCCSWTIIVVDAYQNFVLGKLYCKLDGFFHGKCSKKFIASLLVFQTLQKQKFYNNARVCSVANLADFKIPLFPNSSIRFFYRTILRLNKATLERVVISNALNWQQSIYR